MTKHEIDNDIDCFDSILWQYDQASNIVSLFSAWRNFFRSSTSDFWDANAAYNFSLTDSGKEGDPFGGLGLSLIGAMLGVPRPQITTENEGGEKTVRQLGTELYRKLLRGWALLAHSDGSAYTINRFLAIVFGEGNVTMTDDGAISSVPEDSEVTDPGWEGVHHPMTISYDGSKLTGEEALLFNQHPELVQIYPCGVRCHTEIGEPGPIGLNTITSDGESVGQDLENFAMTKNYATGGAFSAT